MGETEFDRFCLRRLRFDFDGVQNHFFSQGWKQRFGLQFLLTLGLESEGFGLIDPEGSGS